MAKKPAPIDLKSKIVLQDEIPGPLAGFRIVKGKSVFYAICFSEQQAVLAFRRADKLAEAYCVSIPHARLVDNLADAKKFFADAVTSNG